MADMGPPPDGGRRRKPIPAPSGANAVVNLEQIAEQIAKARASIASTRELLKPVGKPRAGK